MTILPTRAGYVTRGEVYSKLLHHLTEAQELSAVMAHLHNTESKDRLNALSWLAVSENFKRLRHTLTTLAMGSLQ